MKRRGNNERGGGEAGKRCHLLSERLGGSAVRRRREARSSKKKWSGLKHEQSFAVNLEHEFFRKVKKKEKRQAFEEGTPGERRRAAKPHRFKEPVSMYSRITCQRKNRATDGKKKSVRRGKRKKKKGGIFQERRSMPSRGQIAPRTFGG